MLSIASDTSGSSADILAALHGLNLLDEAIDKAHRVRTEVSMLADDTAWASKGVRQVLQMLSELTGQVGSVGSDLGFHRDMLQRAIL